MKIPLMISSRSDPFAMIDRQTQVARDLKAFRMSNFSFRAPKKKIVKKPMDFGTKHVLDSKVKQRQNWFNDKSSLFAVRE